MKSGKTPVLGEDKGLLVVLNQLSVARVVIFKAVRAVNGAVVARQKRNLRVLSAFGADNVMHRAVLVIPAAGTSRIIP